jgi:hypothetical protein
MCLTISVLVFEQKQTNPGHAQNMLLTHSSVTVCAGLYILHVWHFMSYDPWFGTRISCLIQSTLVIPASVVMDFSYNR